MNIDLAVSDFIAVLALLLSMYSVFQTVRFNKKQASLIESQEKLNERLMHKNEAETIEKRKARLTADFLKVGVGEYKLQISNKGNSPAQNVVIEFPEGNDCIVQSDIDEKFPLELLESGQFVDLMAAVYMSTKPKHTIKLVWDDGFCEHNEKLLYPTL